MKQETITYKKLKEIRDMFYRKFYLLINIMKLRFSFVKGQEKPLFTLNTYFIRTIL